MTKDFSTNGIEAHAPTRQPPPNQPIEIYFLKTLCTLERFCSVRCRLLKTRDTPYNYEAVNDVIIGKIIKLHSMVKDSIYRGMEDDLLSEVERILGVRYKIKLDKRLSDWSR